MASNYAQMTDNLPDAALDSESTAPGQSERSRKLGEWLMIEGLISERQLGDALAYQSEHGGRLGEILVKLGIVETEEYVAFLARAAGVGSIRLPNYAIRPEYVNLVPREIAARHELVPVDRFGDQLVLAMVCPLNYGAVSEVESVTGLEARTVLCSSDAFRLAYEHFYPRNGSTQNT